MSIYVDTECDLSIERVRKEKFIPAQKSDFNLGFSDATYWYRIEASNITKDLYIEVSNPEIDSIQAYFILTNNSIKEASAGANLSFSSRNPKTTFPTFKIPLSTQTIYLRVRSQSMLNIPIQIKPQHQLTKDNISSIIAFSFLHAIILIALLYNLTLFIILRTPLYGYYTFYLFTVLFVSLSITGYGYQLIWPNSPSFNYIAPPLSVNIMLFSFCLFTRHVLNLYKYSPFLNNSFKILEVFSIVLLITSIWINKSIHEQLLHIMPLIGILLAIIGTAIGIKNKYPPAKYYLIGWSCFLCGATLHQLKNWGIIADNVITSNLSYVGVTLETIFFSFGVIIKLKDYKQEISIANSKLDTLQQQLITPSKDGIPKGVIDKDEINQFLTNPLSDREFEILALISKGKTNKEIANDVFVSVNTIKTHTKNIYEKLGVNNRTEAVSKVSTLH